MDRTPLVSVFCIAYNHEPYIAQAIESFLMQKTSFPFEVIIHDDASTDRTADIIREYAQKYPDIIKPILETENQLSQGKRFLTEDMFRTTRGKYFALCEGDDYWTDPDKLQIQADYMLAHPECSMCIHNADDVDVNGKVTGWITPTDTDRIMSTEEVISRGGAICATNAIFSLCSLMAEQPSYFSVWSGDVAIAMHLATSGQVYSFARSMSAYRRGVPNSAMTSLLGNDNKAAMFMEKMARLRRAFDEYSGFKYHDTVEAMARGNEVYARLYRREYRFFGHDEYRREFKELPAHEKLKFFVKRYFPRFAELYVARKQRH